MQALFRKAAFFLLLTACFINVSAQKTIVSGIVLDAETLEPVPFVNIGFMKSPSGMISKIDGTFYLSAPTSTITDTLIFSSIGYQILHIHIVKDSAQELEIHLTPLSTELDEVVVRPGVNPAFKILDKIDDHKKQNDPERLSSYSYKVYTKLRLDVNNIDDDFKNQPLFKNFGFVFDYMDSSEVFTKNYLPVLLSESTSRFYYSKSPPLKKEVIDASRVSGLENSTFSQFSGKMYQKLNIYDDFITFFDPGFISPIAGFGRLYYKYYLEDSAFIDGSWCRKISFKPKRTQERTFYGYFWVADTSYAIQQFQLRVSADVNLNLIRDMIAVNEYKKLNDTTWFLSKEDLVIDFNVVDKGYGLFGRKTAVYDSIIIDQPVPKEIRQLNTDTYVTENAEKNSALIEQANKGLLTAEDQKVYKMVDSVKNVPAFKTIYALGNMLGSRYLVTGPLEIGPYYTLISGNVVEGTRLKMEARTSNAFSTSLMLGGHAAYGLKDDRFKYGLYFNYMFDTDPRTATGASFYHDIRQLGKSNNAFLDDNFMASILRRQPNYKLTMVDQSSWYIEHEWMQGLSNTVTFRYQTVYPTAYVPFMSIPSPGDTVTYNSLTSSEVTLLTHFAYKEKFLLGKFERVSLGTKSPSFDFEMTYGFKGLMGSSYEYLKLQLQISDKLELNPIGYMKLRITAGMIFGNVPYPLLKLHEGNETYAYDPQAFNMMNYYEFASDRYINVFAEHHFQGFFLNKIPLLRRLHLREVVSANILAGSLDAGNRNVMVFPAGLHELKDPYMEAGAGLENIFRFVRVDAMWRFSYLDHPDVQKFGIRATMQFNF